MVTSESDQPRYVPDDARLLRAIAEDLLTAVRVITEHLNKVENLPTPCWDEEAKLSLRIATSVARMQVEEATIEDHLRGRRLWFQLLEEDREPE